MRKSFSPGQNLLKIILKEDKKRLTQSIEESFLIDLLNTSNVIYCVLVNFNGILLPLAFYAITPTKEVQLCLKRSKSEWVGIAHITDTPAYVTSTKICLISNRNLGKKTPKTFRKKLYQVSSKFSKIADFG